VQRIDFDYAYALSSADGLVYYSSSSDHAVHALDLATGETQWRYFTEGPVRLAPAVQGGRVFFSSDDGYIYCLDGKSGQLIWKHRPQIPDERLAGNDQVISRHPARSGVLVDADRAYTTFGVLSPEGIVVTCLNAQTGAVIWRNETSGTRYATQPHFQAMGGVSPQGYLALCDDVLIVPCGRATPALFDAKTGELIYHESEGLFPGGAWTMTFGDLVFTPCEYLKKPNAELPGASEAEISDEATMVALRASTGQEVFHLRGALRGVITDRGILNLIGRNKLMSVSLKDVLDRAPGGYLKKLGSSEGHFVEASAIQRWETPVKRIYELIQAGSTLIAGQRGAFACYDAGSGRLVWKTTMPGDVHELVVVGGDLLLSTTEGEIRCYRIGRGDAEKVVRPITSPIVASGSTKRSVADLFETADVSRGYAIALGRADAETLAELAQRPGLSWSCAAGGRDATILRERLADAGLYGRRIAVHKVSTDPLPYADYMANLAVFFVDSVADLREVSASELYRVTRPHGSVAVITCLDDLRPQVEQWLTAAGIPRNEWKRVDLGLRIQRGRLPGAGAWTHQYADVGRSGASNDQRVRLPLKTLWFGGLGPADIVSRHYRAPAPLAVNGYLFVPGNESLHAVDAYNGRVIWQREFPGVGRWPAAHRGGSLAADADGLYVPLKETCLRLDPATGATLFKYLAPKVDGGAVPDITKRLGKARGGKRPTRPNEPAWEFLAVTDSAVVGTIARPNIMRSWWSQARPENVVVFVLDKQSGKLRWSYRPKRPISSTGIVIAGNRMFLAEGLAEIVAKNSRRGTPVGKERDQEDPRALLALDMDTGEQLWRTENLGPSQDSLWTAGGVILATVPENHGNTGSLGSKRPGLSAFSAIDGSLLWSRDRLSGHTPVIIGETVYLAASAHNLHTGEPIHRVDPLTGKDVPLVLNGGGGCGAYAGCPSTLMKRSGSLGFIDLQQQNVAYHFPNMRASCWINMIPACGLVLVPEGASSCPCAYNYKASIAFVPAERHNHWGLFSGSKWKEDGRISSLHLNFGAPGDKSDQDGTIWYAFPRPSTVGPRGAGGMGRPLQDELPVELLSSSGDIERVSQNPDWTRIVDTDRPWIHSCALQGPVKLRIRLDEKARDAQGWEVTLFFRQLDPKQPPARFDVKLQGQIVDSDMNRSAASNDTARPITKTFSVDASDILTLELIPCNATQPLLAGLAIRAK